MVGIDPIRLTIKIDNQNPLELNQLTISLNALACQYDSFLRKSKEFDYHKSQRKLYISKLENGSLYAELLPVVMPLLNDFNSIIAFGYYLKAWYNYFLGKGDKPKEKLTKTDCTELSKIVAQTANDSGSNLDINIKGNNNVVNVINIGSIPANAIQNGINKYIEETPESPKNYNKELMYWANANFIKTQQVNDKVIIEKIDKKPKKVIFEDENDKYYCTTHNTKFKDKNWQDLAYIVDVEVSYIQGEPKEYKITKLYKEEVFDPQED